MNYREVEELRMHDLPVILPVNLEFYIMYPHNEKWVLGP
jgi:hypothetical protein